MAGLYRTPPIYCESGAGARFRDFDGNEYLDFNVSDLSMSAGFGPPAIVAAVSAQVARGAHFLLPTLDAVEVAERLAELVGLPFWQATLSATGANTEVLRIARIATGRERVVGFGGHYHGHLEETLVKKVDGVVVAEVAGLRHQAGATTRILAFNDLAALEQELRSGEVALVPTEPALCNCNIVLPADGFLAGVRALTKKYGTLYANAIALAVAHAAPTQLLRVEDYERFTTLSRRLADGLKRLFTQHDLPWRAIRLGPRSGYCLETDLPRNGEEAARSMDANFIDARRVYCANRGVWDAVLFAGPQVSVAHTVVA